MKTFCALSFLLLLPFVLFGQEKNEKPIQLYGFIRNALYADSYRGVDATQDQFYLLPLYAGTDANGDHINEDFQSNMTAIASRLGTRITGPEVLGAKSSAQIEFDFGGLTSLYPSVFRIRHAYMKLNWEQSALTVGQTWHPFWGDAICPHVASLNTGAPFQPFNRSPQVRFDYNLNESLSIIASAVYENQYTSKGFYTIVNDVDKTMPLRYSGLPELVLMAKYKHNNITLGMGAEYKSILPIDITSPDGDVSDNIDNYKTSITNNSYGLVAYGNYTKDKLYILLKGVYGQNLTHLTMPGGYGVKSVDATTGAYEYTNYNNYAALANITYGKKWQAGLFLGYGANMGTSDALVAIDGAAKTAGTFTSVESMYRIAPSATLNVSSFRISAEYEITSADYGSGTMNLSDGLYSSTVNATNHRLLIMMMYLF